MEGGIEAIYDDMPSPLGLMGIFVAERGLRCTCDSDSVASAPEQMEQFRASCTRESVVHENAAAATVCLCRRSGCRNRIGEQQRDRPGG